MLNYVLLNDEFKQNQELFKAIQDQLPKPFVEEVMTLAEQLKAEGKAEAALNVLRETGNVDLAARVAGLTIEQIRNLQA